MAYKIKIKGNNRNKEIYTTIISPDASFTIVEHFNDKMVIFNNPQIPTGTVISVEEISLDSAIKQVNKEVNKEIDNSYIEKGIEGNKVTKKSNKD